MSNKEASFKHFIAGGFGGLCLVLTGHPMDLVKVRLQTMHTVPGQTTQHISAVAFIKQTFKVEGFRGFYRGLAPPLIGIFPILSTCFWSYAVGQDIMKSLTNKGEKDVLSIFEIGIAGGFSAVPTTFIMTPGERIKCLLQVQGELVARGEKPIYNGFLDCTKHVYREGGVSSLFRGWQATLLRDIPGCFAYFAVYEFFKRRLSNEGIKPSISTVLLSGGFAGIVNWAVSIPMDVIKSRLQTAPAGHYRGVAHVFSELVEKEGPRALFKGITPALVRAFPANAACFFGVEIAHKIMDAIGI